jgi:integrase
VTTYTRIIRRDLAPLADMTLDKINSKTVQSFVSTFALDHSPKTVTSVYGLICAVMSEAAPDVRLRVRMPQRRPVEISIPDQEEVQRMISFADPELRAAIILASTMGLRRAEISALRWSDVRNDTLRISRAYAKDEYNGLVLKAPKSTAGNRVLPIPPAAARILQRPAGARDDDAIVPLTPDAITRRFERLCDALDLHYHFHALRHYYASVLLSLGVPDKYAMQRMGHSTPTMLKQVYQHLMQDKKDEIDDQLAAYFK